MNKDEKDSAFTQAMQDVTPLSPGKASNKASLNHRPAPISKRPTVHPPRIKDTLSDGFIPECGDFLQFMRPGIQKAYLKQIRNARIPIEDQLDLHGYRAEQAGNALLSFLDHAQQASYKLVLIVHGKGHHSGDAQPVLKTMVNKWLQSIPEVLAFVSAQPKDGGTGAVYVLLKKRANEA
ncbi:hypothetical protein MNBD_GAMMA10-2387 [hydrothermal vent metagenome]|uniref:Smr domain-containing protein n=1 Tax=hydrothermal vent metagenome TaxID=652676 RepID=A0A3B0YC23_9ZZZZ